MKTTLMTRALPLLALALAAAGCPSSDGTCESAAACADGEICFEGQCRSGVPTGSCTPPTTGTLLTGAISPAAPTTVCADYDSTTWPQVVAPIASGWETALGEFAVGQTVTFDVPAGTSSVTIHQQGVAAAASFVWPYYGTYYEIPNSCVPTAIRTPNGGTVYDDDFVGTLVGSARDPRLKTASYLGITQWAGSFTVPATSRLLDLALTKGELPPGTWSFQVNDWNRQCAGMGAGCSASTAGRYDVTVIARPGPYVSTGTLDVAIYLVGGSVSAASAAASPAYRRFVNRIGEILGRGGICLGNVTFFDVPSWVSTAYGTTDVCASGPCSDLAQLFSLASPSVDGVHLFLVDVLSSSSCSGGGGQIVGIDGSIPGPSGLPGTVNSGAAMSDADISTELINDQGTVVGTCTSAFDLHCKADFSAYVAAHEIGHWLGLYHTTEATGDQFDPLDDTGTCSCDACGTKLCGGSYGMAPSDCMSGGCAGGDDLMFWVIDLPVSVGRLTAEQGLVMRVNPAVK